MYRNRLNIACTHKETLIFMIDEIDVLKRYISACKVVLLLKQALCCSLWDSHEEKCVK